MKPVCFWILLLSALSLSLVIACGSGDSDGDKDDDATDADDDITDDDTVDEDTADDDTADNDTADDDDDDDTADDDVIDDDDDDDTVVYEYSIKTIGMSAGDIMAALPAFAERGFILYLNTLPRDIGSSELEQLLLTAAELGVTVRLWPLLNGVDGSWANEDNLNDFLENARDTLNFAESVADVVDAVVVNSELGMQKIDLIRQYFNEGDWAAILAILLDNRNLAQLELNQAIMADFVEELQNRGYLAQVTTYPFIMDDLEDGDPDLQDVANVLLSGSPWDIYSFTPYTTAYTQDLGFPLGPFFPYAYSQRAYSLFGPAAEIALGIVGNTSHGPGYTSTALLAADVAAAKAAGIRRISVFHLAGMLEDGQFDDWADALLAEPAVPPNEPLVPAMIAAIHLGDFLLNFVP